MTREEAIEVLQQDIPCEHDTDLIEALEMAIKALDQEPCEDAISRQSALDAFGLSEKTRKYGGDHSGYDTMMLYEIQDVLEGLPSVQPKQTGWISVEERLPEKLQDVLIYFVHADNEYDVAYMRKTFDTNYKANGAENEWVSSMGETTYADYEVIAWSPLPKWGGEETE